MIGLIPTISYKKESIQKALNTGHILATELADYLTKKGVPFREAHHITGEVVKKADTLNKQIHELSLTELQAFSDQIEADITDVLSFEAAVNSKHLIGGTSLKALNQQLEAF